MTKDELKARYGRIANDPSQLEMFKDDVINGDVLTDVPAPTIEDAGKVLKVNAAGELEYGAGGGGGETDVSVHVLHVEASISTDGELIISNFQCDSLPENTWFEEPVCHVAFSITLLNEAVSQEPFEFANILHYYRAADVFTDGYWGVNFNLDENKLRVSWSGINLVLDDGTMIFDSGEDLNLYSHTISPIPVDIAGGGGDDTSAIVYDVIAPALKRQGFITEPIFEYEDHLFCYGREGYDINRLDEGEIVDLITGTRYYYDRKAEDTLASPLYVWYDGTYYLNYNGFNYPLQQDVECVDTSGDLTFYYYIFVDLGGALTLSFYYNLPTRLAASLNLIYDDEPPIHYEDFMWYAGGNPARMTLSAGIMGGAGCVDSCMIFVQLNLPGDLVCTFVGSNGMIQFHYWIEIPEEGPATFHSEANWSQYHLPGTGGSDTPFDPTKLPELSFSGSYISATSADFDWPSPSEDWNKKPTLLLIAPDGQEQFAFVKSNGSDYTVLGLLDDDFNTLPATIDCYEAEASDVKNYTFEIHTPSIAAPGELTMDFESAPDIIDGVLGIWVRPTK